MFPTIKYHKDRAIRNLCVSYQVKQRCWKGCHLTHIFPSKMLSQDQTAINNSFQSIYNWRFINGIAIAITTCSKLATRPTATQPKHLTQQTTSQDRSVTLQNNLNFSPSLKKHHSKKEHNKALYIGTMQTRNNPKIVASITVMTKHAVRGQKKQKFRINKGFLTRIFATKYFYVRICLISDICFLKFRHQTMHSNHQHG